MQVLLTTLNAKYIHMNLAIRLLYALHKEKPNLHWKEFTIKQDFNEIATHCAQYDIVCFSCYIWNITQTLEVAALIKELNPNAKILLGGPEVSYEWEPIIALPQIDYIIDGEGEIPFTEFLNYYPNVAQVSNLIYKNEEGVQQQSKNALYDLSNYVNVNPYSLEPSQDVYNKVSYIETSRGCPYKCEFCLASLDNKVRYLPNATIKENLLYLMQHGRVIKFLDRTFNIKRDFTIDIFEFILQHHRPENVFQFEITADILHPDIIKFIQEKIPKGLFRFEIGIQTVNQQANLEVSRKQSFEKTKSIIHQVRDYVDLHLDLIVGLPLDYFNDIKYSFEEVFKLFPPELQLGFLKFLKGTPVRHKASQHEYEYDPQAPYQIIKSKYLSEQELYKIHVVEEALEIYWNKDRARQTLKYVTANYSVFDFLLALGLQFEQESAFHKHGIKDIYSILYSFIQKHYSHDEVLLQLATLDYYLQHKVKPTDLFATPISKKELTQHEKNLGLNLHKFRYVALPINFNVHPTQPLDIATKITTTQWVVITYNGTHTPKFSIVKVPNTTNALLVN
jgi:anaerobic magnesium-protoporphyrin IX monomethyl ester cyclase